MSADRSGKQADLAHQAAAWVARQDRGLTADEQDQFSQWLAVDPRHGEHLAQQRETARKLKSLAQWRPEHGVRPNPDLLEPPRRVRAFLVPLLAAACLALVTGLWMLRAPHREPSALTSVALPPPTEQRVLDDGSTIDLNRGAQVDVLFTADERRVTLVRGEALFTVKSNVRRPFIVQAGRVAIRAVGTAFNVNLQPAAVEVLVTEGTVAVDKPAPALASTSEGAISDLTAGTRPPAPSPAGGAGPSTSATVATVAAGHRALVPLAETITAPQVVQVTREEMARLLAWQPRLLEFADAPLAHVIAEFNRENRVKMVIDDPALGALPIGASFRSDNVEGFVRLLEASFHVQAEHRDEIIVLRGKGRASSAR